ncbi:MAG TPA: FAD binding domain-containing protein [Candidatus Saccharimonadales bacterium]|jgi:xanthine dehydrogenase small subunit|nr:FAD binding domain-containing protein [Candidatus Saccharimonadales bacterium]
MAVEFLLNGERVRVEGELHSTLLEFLRARGLTGSKEGCAEGECGACAVVMVRERLGDYGQNGSGVGSAYCPINSCLVLLPVVAGQEIYTVEALARNGELAGVQQAMVEHGGSQCGYCTPGFVMSLFAEHYRPGRTGPCDPHAMAGNLCRCTGYRPIRDAALSLGPAPGDDFRRRLSRPAPVVSPVSLRSDKMIFHRPGSVGECLKLLADDRNARLVAGATDLAVEANLRGQRSPHLVSVEAINELRTFHETESEVELGAALALSEIEAHWKNAPPVLSEWISLFASPLIRNRATLGGNLATASPIGDAAPLLLALDAQVRIAGAQGARTVPLSEFFHGYRQTALAAGEILVSIHLPKPFPRQVSFFKVAKRLIDDISTVAAAFALDLDAEGRVARTRLAFGGMAAVPLRATEAEDALTGLAWDETSLHRAQEILRRTLQPISDHRGSAAYRLALAQTLLEKFYYEQHAGAMA